MGDVQNQSLGRGFAILDILVRASAPLTASHIARSTGMHQTTASRILADLIRAGYVRRVSYQQFAPDYGLLALGVESARHFPVLTRPRLAMEHAARMCAGLTVSLTMYWRDQLLYFDQAARGLETRIFNAADYPLHLSSPGLLFILGLPKERAIAALQTSRDKFGWAQPTAQVPPTEEALLQAARRNHRNGTIVLEDWQEAGHISAAIRLPDLDDIPLAAALSGPSDVMTGGTIRLRLQQIRRMLAETLHKS
jgi:DNA-binding IclR family transcriptional regulator